ncbi:alcohol dehydrogenase, partial [Streptomyces rubellomurinus subsp. indigoferus]
AVAGERDPRGGGGSAPAVGDAVRIVARGLSLRGFALLDQAELEAEWRERLAGWLRAGEITVPWTPLAGMDRAPEALSRLFTGDGFGTTVLEL